MKYWVYSKSCKKYSILVRTGVKKWPAAKGLARLKTIEKAGYQVEMMWEDEWNRVKKEREDVREFVNQLEVVPRLEPRDAFFGGKTNAVQLYRLARVEEGEEVRYADYSSVYPWVNKNCVYPMGYPTIITHPQILKAVDALIMYFGLVKCTVLPISFPGSLIFPLPRTREKRPWIGLVTCLQSKKNSSGTSRLLAPFFVNNRVDRPARLSCVCFSLNRKVLPSWVM